MVDLTNIFMYYDCLGCYAGSGKKYCLHTA